MKYVNTHEAKTQLSKLIAAARAGEEIVICQAGKPVARLAAYESVRKKPRLGAGKDKVILRPGWDSPETDAEIAEPESGRLLAVAEALWPDGLQPGLGDPVLLELDAAASDTSRLEEIGYKVFTSTDALRGYVMRRNEESAGAMSLEGAVSG